MLVLPLTESRAADWDAFVTASNDAWLFHLTDWIRVEEQNDRSVSFLVEADGGIVGIFPLYLGRRKYAGVVPVNLLHTGRARSGPALAPGLGENQRRSVLQYMLQHADTIATEHRVSSLEIRLPSLAPSYLPPLRSHVSPLSYFGPFSPIKYGRELGRSMTLDRIVCLDAPSDTLWMELDDDCRKAIRKARKQGVVVTPAQSREDVADYHRIHVENYRHTGARVLPLAHFERLWDAFHQRGCLELLFAESAGQRVAGLLMLSFRDGATYWAGSSLVAFQHLRPNNLLMWEAMMSAKDRARRWFELGPTFPFASPESKTRRIGRFKEQFGGEDLYLYEGVRSYWPVTIASLEILDAVAAGLMTWARRGKTK